MATAYQEARGSPTQDTSDLFGDDDADTDSESDGFEEVHIPNGGTSSKPAPEVVDVDEGEDEEDEDDFLPSRVNKYVLSLLLAGNPPTWLYRYAPIDGGSGPAPAATAAGNPPLKRRRTETDSVPTPGQAPPTARPNGHPSASNKQHPPPAPPPSGPYVPTYFNTSAGRSEPLVPSIINSEPLDELSQEVADWIDHFTQGVNPDHVEVEAKLGILIDKGSNARLGGLSLTECSEFRTRLFCSHLLNTAATAVMPPNSPIDTRFESNMPLRAHKHYNELLNALVAQVVPGQPRVKYSHTKLVDEFYGEGHGEKTRVTRDEKTGKVAACVRKRRIANLDIHSPKQGVDWRISINLEEPASSPSGQPAHTRRKDRISYTHQAFKIDLTQVTSSHAGPNQVRGALFLLHRHTGAPALSIVPLYVPSVGSVSRTRCPLTLFPFLLVWASPRIGIGY
ncbi:mRNA-capping enzyme subunit beta [Ceratobasidium sp. 414]|nr:mRNA-capping enzyme subunit beta [Ceratobasidium sp. 414]